MASEIWKWQVKLLVSSPFGALILKTFKAWLQASRYQRCPLSTLRYPGDATNPQFQFRRPRAPSHLTPRLFIGQLPPGRLIPLTNGWPADLDYEALLRLGDIMGDVVPQGLSQTQINRLPTHIFNAEVGLEKRKPG